MLNRLLRFNINPNIMKNINFLFLVIILFSFCKEVKSQDGFVLSGIAHGVPDSTIIDLINSTSRKTLDSTIVINEKFMFKGKVENPTKMLVCERDVRNYKSIWIENSTMTFEAKLNHFKTAKVTGSETQEDDELLFSKTWPLALYQDSLFQLIYPDTLPRNIGDSLSFARSKSMEQSDLICQNFIKEFPNSPVSINMLNGSKTGWDKELVASLFLLMDGKSKHSEDGKSIARYLKINKPSGIWDKYIDFTQFDTNGKKIKLSDIKGKYILVEFWASWCGPCRKEIPNIIEQYNKYKNKGFEVLAVSFDNDKANWLNAIEKYNLPWINVSDLKGNENEAKLLYGISGIPSNILINEKGIIVAENLRGEGLVNELRIRFKD